MTGRARLLRCYPPAWRERYGNDLAACLDDMYAGRLPVRAAASLAVGGMREWVRSARSNGADLPAAGRVRSGVVTVLSAWAAFVIAGSGFAKISEHFDGWLTDRNRTVPDVAHAVVQDVATVSGVMVLIGLALAVPALLQLLSSGGWATIRRHVTRAAASTAATAAMTVAVGVWAHHLSDPQRNGSNAGYAALFFVWASVVVMTVALWTVATVATARRLALPRRILLAEGALATVVTIGMLVMVLAAAAWWVAMASSAPSFFGGAPGLGRAWTPQLVGMATLMLAALTVGAVGVTRIARAHSVIRSSDEWASARPGSTGRSHRGC